MAELDSKSDVEALVTLVFLPADLLSQSFFSMTFFFNRITVR